MYYAAFDHIVRRSLDSPSQTDPGTQQPPPWDALKGAVSPFAAFTIVTTICVFIVSLVAMRYTLLCVVATLAQVEQPGRDYVPLHDQDPASFDDPVETEAHVEPEMALVLQPALTSSIRQTISHLHNRAGFASRWRGFGCAACIAIVYQLCFSVLGTAFNLVLPISVGSILAGVLSSIILARWAMAWTHVLITEPDERRWYRRVPTFQSWRKIWAPTALAALAQQLALVVPAGMFMALRLNDHESVQQASAFVIMWKVFMVLFVGLCVYIGVVIPSQVALTRCQASLLPEEDESIVRFDRSYGGKVVPAIVGGSGMLSYFDAWKSFDRPARQRLIKLYAKVFAIDLALHVLFLLIFSLQLYLILGDAVGDLPES